MRIIRSARDSRTGSPACEVLDPVVCIATLRRTTSCAGVPPRSPAAPAKTAKLSSFDPGSTHGGSRSTLVGPSVPFGGGVDDRVDAAVMWPRVADAVAELPAGERDALLLYVWEDLGYDEIATALGVPVGTVRSRLNRARRRLRVLREPDGPSGREHARSGRIGP